MPTSFNVWTPGGTAIAAVSSDSPGQPNLLYETGAIILSPNPDGKIFKMIFSTTNGICYAESSDGASWTRYGSNPVLASQYWSKLYKNGSTYWLSTGGSRTSFSSIAVYTSPDLITWTLKNANAIVLGSAGHWDDAQVAQLQVIDIVAGTWYAYYTGAGTGTGGAYVMGLATSPDGVTWTKGGSNPVITAFGPSNFEWHKINGKYYGWSQIAFPSSPISGVVLPSDIMRFSSPSVTGPFTALGSSTYYRNDPTTEGGATVGQVADPSLIEVSGTTYLYYTATNSGGPSTYTIRYATAPMTMAQLVATYEGVVNIPIHGNPSLNLVTVASDSFARANADPIGGNWSPLQTGNTAQLLSNLVTSSSAGTKGDSWWNALSWNADQWSASVASICSGTSVVAANVRSNISGTFTDYNFRWSGTLGSSGSYVFRKVVAGTPTNFTTAGGGTFTLKTGDTLMLAVVGNTISAYVDGYLVATTTDSSISSGAAGLGVLAVTSTANAGISAWSGGTFQAAPPISSFSPQAGAFLVGL